MRQKVTIIEVFVTNYEKSAENRHEMISGNLKKEKGNSMKNIRRNTIIKANAPIVKLMNLIWGL